MRAPPGSSRTRLPGRERLDLVLVRRGLAETRERAQSLITSGNVLVGGQRATRPGQPVAAEDQVQLAEPDGPSFVSRGAHKLRAALDTWAIDVDGHVCLDVGASTGGFTDLLLQRGARRVYAVDVGYGQLHFRLRQDPRVVVMERTNVRFLTSLPESPSFATADVSFISLRLALPPVFTLLSPEATLVTLVKPQFEAGRGQVGKGGVVRDPAVHREVLREMVSWSSGQPYTIVDLVPSPIRGPAGNVEFLALWRRDGTPATAEAVSRVVEESTTAAVHP